LNLMRALEMRLLKPWIQDVGGWHVLDVGCGHGLYSLDMARRGAALAGCDLERPALADATGTAKGLSLQDSALFLVADGAALPLPDDAFDLAVCNCVLEHVADDHGALAAMARSLQPGGLLYLAVDNAEHGLVLKLLERLPARLKGWLLRPQVAAGASVLAGLNDRLDEMYAVLRRYRHTDLEGVVRELGLTILDSRPYLTGVGAVQFEIFHALRGLDPGRGIGRLLYMLSSPLLYPFAAWSDNRRSAQGYGWAIVARREKGASE
jgi:SAM-dependent methyltransferase